MVRYVSTGSIIPLGDGLVGKSVLTQFLINTDLMDDQQILDILEKTKKSVNLEMEFSKVNIEIEDKIIETTLQFYVFPGQVQKESNRTVTFNEIMHIFEFLPMLKSAHVILMVYDTSRIFTLKSLENWLLVSMEKGWVSNNTLIYLISNKVDIQQPNVDFVQALQEGIINLLHQQGLQNMNDNVKVINTSCKTKEGIIPLRENIARWIATNGIKRVI
ncbi:MAG: hypothetical protein OEY49_17790 [Candidatus Heimdallarchaeota archaeon]|nr:hypothetical protein [Candidatus Heimdallarchaeota archaeon]